MPVCARPRISAVDVVRALVGVDGLEIEHVPDHVELVDDPVAAVHVARHPGDLERLAARVALHDRRDLRRRLAVVLHAPRRRQPLQSERDLGLHVGELLLDQLVRGERTAELLAVERVLPRGVPARFRRAERAPGNAVARAVEHPNGPLRPRTFGSRFSSGTATSSITISPVMDGAQAELAFDLRRREPLHALLEDEAADHAVVGLRPDDEDVGDRRVRDPHLAARQPIASSASGPCGIARA
jgi:hypothetical protein